MDDREKITDALGCGGCVAKEDCLSGKPFKDCPHSSILPKLIALFPGEVCPECEETGDIPRVNEPNLKLSGYCPTCEGTGEAPSEEQVRKDEKERILGKMILVRHYSEMLPEGYDMWELKPSDYLALQGEK